MSDLPDFLTDEKLIPEENLFGQYGPYIADPALVHAANTALCLEMPLLLTGDPGCGKSDFAWVAAKALGHKEPLRCHIRSDTKARDLLYHYDALLRFGDAQHGAKDRARDPRQYISLRPLGAALMRPGKPRSVVLIDEIDKAPRDLPNDLLHEIDEMRFEIPEIGDFLEGDDKDKIKDHHDRVFKDIPIRRDMNRPDNTTKPLVIVTSNAERQLPEPFLRRCVFYRIPVPKKDKLLEITKARFPKGDATLLENLVAVFQHLREVPRLIKPPTTAEMLSWANLMTQFHPVDDVADTIEAFAEALEKKQNVDWSLLPGLPVLLKLDEDLATVSPGGRAR